MTGSPFFVDFCLFLGYNRVNTEAKYMTARISKKWTKSLTEAFGVKEHILRGERAEQAIAEYFDKTTPYDVVLYEEDYEKQIAGIDVELNSTDESIGIDVKANLRNNGTFFVETGETGWLFNPTKTSQVIVHVDMFSNVAWMYDRERMKQFILEDRAVGGMQEFMLHGTKITKLNVLSVSHFAQKFTF